MLLGWMIFRLRGKLTRKIIPIRETLAKFFFLCNSVEEGQGETKRSPSVWPDHQHILHPSCRPARPPKQRLTKRSSLTVCNMQPDKLPLFKIERLTRVSKGVCRQDARCSVVPRNNCLFMQSKSLLNGIPKFVLKIERNLNFTAFHLGVKVSEICHKLFETSLI